MIIDAGLAMHGLKPEADQVFMTDSGFVGRGIRVEDDQSSGMQIAKAADDSNHRLSG
jgi:hypothetical protein